MEKCQRVKLSGTSKVGEIIEVSSRRDPVYSNLSNVVFIRVKWDDGSAGEYIVSELRKI